MSGSNEQRFDGTKTAPEYGAAGQPLAAPRAHAEVPAHAPAPVRHPALHTAPPPERLRIIDVEVAHETGTAPSQEVFDRSVEVWTQNHVYLLDPQMVCTEVRSVATGNSVVGHELLGTRLVGGQLDGQPGIQLSYPFPAPGSTAVFQAHKNGRKQYSRTSAVSRVVLRLHVLTVNPSEVIPTWKTITSPRHDEE